MAVTSTPYNHARYLLATGALDLGAGTFKMALVTSTYTPDLDTHQFLSSLTNELSGNGYARSTLNVSSGVYVAKGTNKTRFLTTNGVFTASGGSLVARRAIIFKDTGNAATSPLICSVLLNDAAGGTDVTATDGGSITVTPDATNGFLYV